MKAIIILSGLVVWLGLWFGLLFYIEGKSEKAAAQASACIASGGLWMQVSFKSFACVDSLDKLELRK